jgi:ribose 5-phosphate isomerase A
LSRVSVPIEVIPAAASILLHHLQSVFPASCSFALRSAGKGKAGPVVTDNGNLIIDALFEDDDLFENAGDLERRLKGWAGVVGTGIFILPLGTIILEGSEQEYTF